MHSDRRFLLKSLAATGLAISGVGWGAWAQATPLAGLPSGAAPMDAAADVLALTSGLPASAGAGVLDSAFITGVRSAAQTVRHTALQGLDSAPFQRLGQLLGDERSTLLVGLLDDASATLVLDLVRSAGGRSERTNPSHRRRCRCLDASVGPGAGTGPACASRPHGRWCYCPRRLPLPDLRKT